MKKVIIIEDSPTFCNMLGKKLEAKGWKTILCYNYRDGLKAVKESSEWDVVISDMRLGNDNGIDLLEWMRSNGYQNPFIIMTSYLGRDRQPAERRTGDAAACVAIQELPTIGSYKR